MVTVPEDQSDESKDTITILTQGIARLLDMKCPQYKVDQYIVRFFTYLKFSVSELCFSYVI